MDLADYARLMRRHWRLIVIAALVGGLLAAAYSFTRPKVYASTATGFVSSGPSASPAEASVGDSLAKSRATSYVDVAKSRGTAQGVAQRLRSSESPESLIDKVEVSQPTDTVLIKVKAEGKDPAVARTLANAWIAELSKQVQSIEQSGTTGLRVVPLESAGLPTEPVTPRPLRDIPLGIGVGTVLGLGLAMMRSRLDRRVRDQDTIRRQFGVPVVGSIPESKALDRSRNANKSLALPVGQRPGRGDKQGTVEASASSEALLRLRTNLRYMDVDNPPRVIVVTSPAASDGKSTVASNLACAVAATGQPTVLIDADLRRPVVAQGFGLIEGAGLTDILVGRADVQDVLQPAPQDKHLSVLGAGNTPPNPSEVLGSNAMRSLIKELSADAFVIIDAPPVLPVTDAAVLSTVADGALIVVSAGKTIDSQLQHAISSITEVNGRVLGIVLNKVSRRDTATYYGYKADDYA